MDDLIPETNQSHAEMDVNNNIDARHRYMTDRTANSMSNMTARASRLRFAVNGNVRYILQMFHPPFAHTFMQNALHNSMLRFFLAQTLHWKRALFVIELFFLLLGICLFVSVLMLHRHLGTDASSCFKHIKEEWPEKGILRVFVGTSTVERLITTTLNESMLELASKSGNLFRPMNNEQQRYWLEWERKFPFLEAIALLPPMNGTFLVNQVLLYLEQSGPATLGYFPQLHVCDYAKDYGLLRLTEESKSLYKVQTLTKFISANNETCFGGPIFQTLLQFVVGYDRFLIHFFMASLEQDDEAYLKTSLSTKYYLLTHDPMPISFFSAAFNSFLLTLIFPNLITVVWRTLCMQISTVLKNSFRVIDNPAHLSRATYLNLSTIVLFFSVLGVELVINRYIFPELDNPMAILIAVIVADQFHSIVPSRVLKNRFAGQFYFYFYLLAFYNIYFDGLFLELVMLSVMALTFNSILHMFRTQREQIPIFYNHTDLHLWREQDRLEEMRNFLYSFELWERVPDQ